MPRRFNAKDTEATFFVEERNPFNHAGQLGGGGVTFWGGGIHLDCIILTDAVCDLLKAEQVILSRNR